MNKILRVCFAVLLSCIFNSAHGDARVFSLNTPNTQQVIDTLQQRYGDEVKVELVQEKLVVVGSKQKLDEVSALLSRIDPPPAHLRLYLRDRLPQDESGGTTYSTGPEGSGGYVIDTMEGAFVTIDYSQIAQQAIGAGLWVTIEDKEIEVRSLTLQIRVQNNRTAVVIVSYVNRENQERKIYSNTVAGILGSWIPLLPRPETVAGTITTASISRHGKQGEQIYLRVTKNLTQKTGAIR